MSSSSTVTLGYVSRPNGLSGAVVIHSDPSMTDVFARGLVLEFVPRQGANLRTKVRSAAPVRGGLRVTLEDVRDRNHAEALVGATVQVDRDSLGPLAEGEFFDHDLIGLQVVSHTGETLGELVEVIATGANDVYVARSESGGEVLIPAVAHAEIQIDLAARRMTVLGSALEYSPPPADPSGKPKAERPAKKPRSTKTADTDTSKP